MIFLASTTSQDNKFPGLNYLPQSACNTVWFKPTAQYFWWGALASYPERNNKQLPPNHLLGDFIGVSQVLLTHVFSKLMSPDLAAAPSS